MILGNSAYVTSILVTSLAKTTIYHWLEKICLTPDSDENIQSHSLPIGRIDSVWRMRICFFRTAKFIRACACVTALLSACADVGQPGNVDTTHQFRDALV